ncbi:MAG: zf-HC2 domain-containing protein [Spirochaetia bacterium]|nr:zf-HC2 domain-containing protein [Spirochaetia bacterium]
MTAKCSQFKELIMEMVDGELPETDILSVREHIKSCPECLKYEKELKNMVKITASMRVEAPVFAENRIMAAINSQKKKPAFSMSGVLSYASSFAVILVVATLIIYKPAGGPKSDLTSIKDAPVIVSGKTNISKNEKNTIMPKIAVRTDEKPVTAVRIINIKPKAPAVVEQDVQAASVSDNRNIAGKADAVAPKQDTAVKDANYGVNNIEQAGVITSAKVTPVPTVPGIPLLNTDKAIVANNVINPRLNQAARIVIQVDEESRCVIRIYDERVRKVAEILDETKSAGKYEALWYGKNDSGSTVAEGAYYVYIQIGTRVIKKPIIVIKN